jgi:hypothetical protein
VALDADGRDNLGLCFEIVGGERPLLCDHTEVLDLLNRAMDLFCEGQAVLGSCRAQSLQGVSGERAGASNTRPPHPP